LRISVTASSASRDRCSSLKPSGARFFRRRQHGADLVFLRLSRSFGLI
jgi:hypothetical protein